MPKKTKKTDKKVKAHSKPAAKASKPAAKASSKAKPAKKTAASASKKKAVAKPAAKKAVAKGPSKAELKAGAKKLAAEKKAALKKDAPKKEESKKEEAKGKAAKAPAEPKLKKAKKADNVEVEEAIVEPPQPVRDVVLTDAEGRELCRVKDCDQPWVVEGYCRYHYLLFWKKIQNRKKILSEGKLEQYIEELTSRYPLKFLELIRKDLSSEPDFFSAIQELDIDEGNNIDEFEDENFMEEVRGIGSGDTERVDDEY